MNKTHTEIVGDGERVENGNAPESSARRKFLGGLGSVAAATAAIGAVGLPKVAEAVAVDPQTPTQRANTSLLIRTQAALAERAKPIPAHLTNGDEELYAAKIGNFSKGLPHNALGEPDVAAYNALVKALSTGQPQDFEAIPLGSPDPTKQRRLVDPQSALAFDIEGADSHHLAIPPAPSFSSAEEAGEIVENYWMALLRDVPFTEYTNPNSQFAQLVSAAADDLSKLSNFKGPKVGGKVTPATLFRGGIPGTEVGPYISQFMFGDVNYGAQVIDSRVIVASPGVDYMSSFSSWLSVQNGVAPGPQSFVPGRRYMTTGRDASTYVHIDALYQAYQVATLFMLGHGLPWGDNPYGPTPEGGAGGPSQTPSRVQAGFGTFGGPHVLSLVTEVATRALKAVWYQKWSVHRRLRPEEFAGRIEVQRTHPGRYPLHQDLFNSTVLPKIFARNSTLNGGQGTWLLPMAFPEGSPTHPAYGAGHATVAACCVTVLKAFFDESAPIANPVVPDVNDPTRLVPYTGADAGSLTVGGELNKIAANISLSRNIAGVHWRSDHIESLKLGEQLAISILKDQFHTYNETKGSFPSGGFNGWSLTKFDGTTIKV
jgi:hypothetical protein